MNQQDDMEKRRARLQVLRERYETQPAVSPLPALFYIDISCHWQKGVNQESIRIPHGRRTVAAPWAASSVQNGHLMQPFCFL